MKLLENRVAIVTGAGRGVGRAEALMLARHGAMVVVNDLGVTKDGAKEESSPAEQVVEEIRAAGGKAVANHADVSDWKQSEALVQQAIEEFGDLHIVVNNAGILRDRMMWNMSEDDFDLVVKVNLKGTFTLMHHAAVYWRNQSKAGKPVDGRIINTASSVGLFGNIGQVNYGASKGGVITMSIMAALELKRLGVTVNAICPRAESRMTEGLIQRSEEEIARRHPDYTAALVAYLASPEAADITGRYFEASGFGFAVLEGPRHGAITEATKEPTELNEAIHKIVRNSATPSHFNRDQFWDL